MKGLLMITYRDHKGNKIEVDTSGVIVFIMSIFLIVPSILAFGFTLPTWTVLAIICVGFIHFAVCVISCLWKSVMEEIREEREKEKSENSPGE